MLGGKRCVQRLRPRGRYTPEEALSPLSLSDASVDRIYAQQRPVTLQGELVGGSCYKISKSRVAAHPTKADLNQAKWGMGKVAGRFWLEESSLHY